MNTFYLIGVSVVLFALIWMSAVGDLMARRDQDFPGKNDKLAWALILCFGQLFGGIVYWCCRIYLGRAARNGDLA